MLRVLLCALVGVVFVIGDVSVELNSTDRLAN